MFHKPMKNCKNWKGTKKLRAMSTHPIDVQPPRSSYKSSTGKLGPFTRLDAVRTEREQLYERKCYLGPQKEKKRE